MNKIHMTRAENTILIPSFVTVLGVALLTYYFTAGLSLPVLIGITAMIALVPLVFLKPEIGLLCFLAIRNVVDLLDKDTVVSVGAWQLNLAALLGLILLPWAWHITITGVKKMRLKSMRAILRLPLIKPWLIFIGLTATSLVYTINFSDSLEVFIKLLNFFALYLVALLLAHRYGVKKIITIIAISLVVPVCVAIWQFLTSDVWTTGEIVNRIQGPFTQANAMGFVMVVGLGILLTLIVMTKNYKEKTWWISVSLIFLALLVFTITRNAWLGFLSLAWIWLTWHKPKISATGVGLMLIFVIMLTIPALNSFTNTLNNQLVSFAEPSEQDRLAAAGSLSWRQRSWAETFPALLAAPVYGYGLGSFPEIRKNYITYASDLKSLEAHNDYLGLLIEIGIIGLWAYLLIFYEMIKLSRHLRQLGSTERKLVLGRLSLILAVLVMSFFDNILRNAPLQWLFWSFIGATMVIEIPQITKSNDKTLLPKTT